MQASSRSPWLSFAVTLSLLAILLTFGALAPAPAAAEGVPLSADEQQMVNLVNQARNSAGLPPLAVDPVLSGLARIKAQDMASNGYFSHTSPTYGSSFDMMKKVGVKYRYAGENLAKAPSVSSAYKTLMYSSGHRSNMLNRNYDRVGVGVITSGKYKIIVQIFTGGQKVVAPAPVPQPTPQPQPQPESQPRPNPEPQPVAGLSADEQKMLDLVNRERAGAGLKPLQIDPALVKLARLKARDMIDKGYFSHTSPTYGLPFEMMKSYGVEYRYAGENLAGAPTVDSAHINLMNSPGHRANILKGDFTKFGIGVVPGGPYGKMFVQMFIG